MKERVLIIRSSALGDVAMTIPVIYPLVEVYKEVEFYFLSLPKHKSLLLDAPANLHFIPMDKNGKHKGIKGLWRLYKELRGMNFSYVADLHGVIRSWALDMLLKCSSSCKVAIINKGREEKSRLIGHSNGVLYPLESTFQRYKEVFSKLGFETGEVFTPFCLEKENHEGSYWIGIAPFAKHLGKCYPVERVEEVVKMLSSYPTIKIFLFGGGEKEKSICEEWEKKYPHTYSTIGEGDLRADMKRLGEIDILLSMDSANMHIASLMGTRVVSIWGATHPYLGFYGYNQRIDDFLWNGDACSPCSVFGNRTCKYGNYKCMSGITPKRIVQKLLEDVAL